MRQQFANDRRLVVVDGQEVRFCRLTGVKRKEAHSVWPSMKAPNSAALKRWIRNWMEKGRLPV